MIQHLSRPIENDPLRQLAESTEESAVREDFDVHNARIVKFVSAILTVVATIGTILLIGRATQAPTRLMGGVLLLVVAVACFRLATGRSPALRNLAGINLSAWLVGAIVVELALVGALLVSHRSPGDIVAFGVFIAWGMLALRMPFARRVIAHATMIGLIVVATETSPVALRSRFERYFPLVASHGFALLAGGFISRRSRRRVVDHWRERRTAAVEQLRMRDELRFAREVQLSMLPEAPPSLPWIDIAGTSIPATEVGGDYYDYFRVGDSIALVCGDVAGHGLASGIVLTALRSGFMLLRESLVDPAAVLTRLHELVDQTSRRRMLATAAVAMIDPGNRTARIASAGHPPVMIRSNGAVRTIELFGPPLGVRLPIVIAETEIAVAPGDVLVLHSDGVYETANEIGELYGLDRLAALIAASDGATATELRDAILRDVTAFRGSAAQADDVTVVVAVMRPEARGPRVEA